MPLILNLETATKNCSVALSSYGKLLECIEIADTNYSHAEKLHLFIEEILRNNGFAPKDLDAVAIGRGPGSYTGLRIGTSAAKGLCFALDIPLIAVDTLAVLAQAAEIDEGIVVPMIDSRRMEVYSAIFNPENEMLRGPMAEIISADYLSRYRKDIYICGDCQEKLLPVLTGDRFTFLPEVVFPSASQMVGLSHSKYNASDFEDLAYFEPFYLKDFIAGGGK